MGQAKKGVFFLGHIEEISWKAFENYPEVLREMIRGKSGIYALYHNGNLYYVGLASNLMGRLKAHLKDRHDGHWERFSVYLTADDRNLKELESLLLRITRRSGNAVSGKLSGSKNLHSLLNKKVKDLEFSRRAAILGGAVARRRRKNKASKHKGAAALSEVSDKDIRISGVHGGKKYYAVLKKKG
jgi:hypothetical protein